MATEKRLIDANALIEALPIVTEDRKITLYGAVADFMIMISAMPTVDAVEVVRCIKCKWWDPDSEYCQFWHGVRHPGHYCGEGEKKDGKR